MRSLKAIALALSLIIVAAVMSLSTDVVRNVVAQGRVRVNGVSQGVGVSYPLTGTAAAGCTAGAIPYSFSGDSNTGISESAADTLQNCVAGFSALTLTSAQATFGVAQVTIGGTSFAGLGSPGNGTFTYCTDCTIANPCAGGGTGAMAKRINGIWICN